jgi:hypothetical protein
LLHIFELYNGWANAFQPGCSLSPPDFGQFTTNGIAKMPKTPEVEFSADQRPILAINGSSMKEEEELVEVDEEKVIIIMGNIKNVEKTITTR